MPAAMPETRISTRLAFANLKYHGGGLFVAPKHHALLGAIAVAAMLSSLIVRPPLLFVWNSSSSVPRGLYWVEHSGVIRRGEFVVARLPLAARQMADERRYVPATVPMVKKVAGLAGDRACASGSMLRIGRRLAVRRLRMDPSGRSLPWWNDCRRLSVHEVMLLGSSRLSFDGRYFGPTRLKEIEGHAVPVWTR